MFRKMLVALLCALAFSFFSCDTAGTGDESNGGGGGTPPATNEGSVDNPVELTVDTLFHAKVGKLEDNKRDSYYKFTTVTAGDYTIAFSNFSPSSATGITPELYNDAAFSGFPQTSYYTSNFAATNLLAATTYYLQLVNLADSDKNLTFDILVTKTP